MPHLASYFPRVEYDLLKDGRPRQLTDITRRFKFNSRIVNDVASYFDHVIQDGEKPYVLADEYYEDPSLDWIIMMSNRLVDPFYDWPLSYETFRKFIKQKYPPPDNNAFTDVHHYEWIVTHHGVLNDGTVVPEEVLVVDEATYNGLAETDKRRVTVFEYEEAMNEARRNIRILDSSYVPVILKEAELIFNRG